MVNGVFLLSESLLLKKSLLSKNEPDVEELDVFEIVFFLLLMLLVIFDIFEVVSEKKLEHFLAQKFRAFIRCYISRIWCKIRPCIRKIIS